MKKSLIGKILFVVFVTLFIHSLTIAQSNGDYQSKQTGIWGAASTWQIYSGGWIDASVSPSSTNGVITIKNGHTVTINTDITIDQLMIEVGAALTTTGVLNALVVAGSSNTVNGTFTVSDGTTMEVDTLYVSNGNLIITNGATLQGEVIGDNINTIRVDSTGYFGAVLTVNTGTTNIASLHSASSLSGIVYVSDVSGAASLALQTGKNFVFKNILSVRPNGTIDGPGILTYSGELVNAFYNNGTVNADVKFKSPNTLPLELMATSVAANALWNNVEIDNPNGVIVDYPSVPSKVTINGTLKLTNGKLTTTNTNILILGASATVSGGSSSSFIDGPIIHAWSTATATKTYPIGKGTTYRPVDISLTTPSSPEIRVEMINSSAAGIKGTLDAISTMRYYQSSLISGTAASGGTLKLTYGADDAVSSSTTLVVAQCATVSGTYTSLGMSANDAGSVTSLNYNPASGDYFLLGSTSGNSLPVEMTTFTVSVPTANSAVLHWSTATEVGNQGFEIERRLEQTGEWTTISFVPGAGTSSVPKDYSYTDMELTSGMYIYRLKQIDNSGLYIYSASVQADVGSAIKDFQLLSNYPNPFNPATTIRFSVPANGYTSLKVYNMLGQEVAILFEGVAQAGHYIQVTFDASRLASGIFFSRLQYMDKTLIQRMLLVK